MSLGVVNIIILMWIEMFDKLYLQFIVIWLI